MVRFITGLTLWAVLAASCDLAAREALAAPPDGEDQQASQSTYHSPFADHAFSPRSGPPPVLERLPPVELLPEGAVVVEEIIEEVIVPPQPVKIWKGSLEFGLNGSHGNTESHAIRVGSTAKRKRPGDVLSLELDYLKGSTEQVETEHHLLADGRNEWLFPESPWSTFLHGTTEYDEFRAFDLRVTADAGVGYALLKSDVTELVARLGGGFSREFGGPDDTYVPEGVAGLSFERQLTERQKLTASVEYFPDVTEFADYRINSKGAWEMLVDPEWNLSLRLSVTDRYDSTPNGAVSNDLDYAALLLWKF